MKKIEIDFTAPTIYKIQTLQDTLNELLEKLNENKIIELEVETDGQNDDKEY